MFAPGTQFNYTLNGHALPPPVVQDLPIVVGNVIPANAQFQLIWNGLDDTTITLLASLVGERVSLICTEPSSGNFFTVTVVPRLELGLSRLIGGIGLDLIGTAIIGTGTYYDLAAIAARPVGGMGINTLGSIPLGQSSYLVPTPVNTTFLQMVALADASIATPVIFAAYY